MNNSVEHDGESLLGLNTHLNDSLNELVQRVELESKNEIENTQSLMNIIQQLQKRLQQQRAAQSQRLKSLKSLHEQYMQTSSDLANMHKEQQISMHSELRKELTALQKKMMDEARQEEITNVRKSLQTMLSSV